MAAGERIFEVLDVEPEVQGQAGRHRPCRRSSAGSITTASPSATARPRCSHDIDLHVAPGQTVAFVGETGAGKSSMINLLMRFADVWAGSLTIDGHDVRDVTQRSLRSQLGIVLQDTFLFGGTVRDNIAFARPDATDGGDRARGARCRRPRLHPPVARRATTPRSRSGASASRSGSASCSPSPAPCWPTRAS